MTDVPLKPKRGPGAPKGQKNALGHKGGGTRIFSDEVVKITQIACRAGLTDFELAQVIGVNESTIHGWKIKHPEFKKALQTGKAFANKRVERSLYHRAVGYSFESEKIFGPSKDRGVTIVPYTEHVPPDTEAAKFWLKNREPDKWRDKVEVVNDGLSSVRPILNITITPPDPNNADGMIIENDRIKFIAED
jgi:hypothetical protein